MADWSEEESEAVLAKHSLGRTGVQVKLDKGFEPGDYCVYVEYWALADRIGFTAARRQALDYASRLYGHLVSMGASKPATYGRFKTSQGLDVQYPSFFPWRKQLMISLPHGCGSVLSCF